MINKQDRNKYLSGNIITILFYMEDFIGDNYDFKYDRNDICNYLLECYCIIENIIKIDNIEIVNMNDFYKSFCNDNDIQIINVKKYEINFNKTSKDNLIKVFKDSHMLMTFLTNKLKLQNTFIDTNDIQIINDTKIDIKQYTNTFMKCKNNTFNRIKT